ncbi:hypothetical protein DM806_24045 [Sphingobium lactosutens]|uniref:hypothetical protein n=1 Tax=Sphingobium lactosutens TaxID=522773 RepID=UPI0015B9E3BB|nr:hypothetical protein [Sphingobium lactosutens]NWK98678.1 hypothetical protein [Sphingobium lactosutens]
MDVSTVPLQAARNMPLREEYGFLGEDDAPFDLTDATLKMEIRLYGAQPGDALVTLNVVTTDAQGIRILDVTGGLIRISIDQTTLAAMPGGPTGGALPNQPDPFFYDLIITRLAPAEALAMAGPFTLFPGVTRP